jgi:phage shock protein A
MMVMMEKKKTLYKKAEKALAQRDPYVGMVLEEMRDKLKIALEGYEIVQNRIDRLDSRVNQLEVKVDRMETI